MSAARVWSHVTDFSREIDLSEVEYFMLGESHHSKGNDCLLVLMQSFIGQ